MKMSNLLSATCDHSPEASFGLDRRKAIWKYLYMAS